jgi:hypothetical protein
MEKGPLSIESLPGTRSTKSQIVAILSVEWPLSCRKIYNKLARSGNNITYQAVHKAILQMVAEGMLIRKGQDYSLNLDWINEIERFSRGVEDAYLGGKGKSPELEGDVTQENFERGYDVVEFLIDNLLSGKFVPLDSRKIEVTAKVQHMWNPFVLVPSDFGRMKALAPKIDAKVICRGNTRLDEVIAKFYRAFRVKVLLGADVPETPEVVIVGDTMIQIFNPEEMRRIVDETYRKTKTVLSLNLVRTFSEISYRKMRVTVLVNRNPLAASATRKELLEKFRKK